MEIVRVRRAMASERCIVLVHTCGKVGSTAFHSSLHRIGNVESFQTHFITKTGTAKARSEHGDVGERPFHLELGEKIALELERNPERRIVIVTLVREPVARAISDLFENPRRSAGIEDLNGIGPEELLEKAREMVSGSLSYMENWFENELSDLIGSRFFDLPFDPARGFGEFGVGRFSVLVGRLEGIDRFGREAVGPAIGLRRPLEIRKKHSRERAVQGDQYVELKKALRLSEGQLDEVYSSRFCRHFYAPEELESFRRRWKECRLD